MTKEKQKIRKVVLTMSFQLILKSSADLFLYIVTLKNSLVAFQNVIRLMVE
jgi:hypothetical protein